MDNSKQEMALKYYMEGFKDAYTHFYLNHLIEVLEKYVESEDQSAEEYEKMKKYIIKTQRLFGKIWKIPSDSNLRIDDINRMIGEIGSNTIFRMSTILGI